MRAGEAARIVVLHQEAGTSRAEALGTAVVERLYDVLALLLLRDRGLAVPPRGRRGCDRAPRSRLRCSASSWSAQSSWPATAPGRCASSLAPLARAAGRDPGAHGCAPPSGSFTGSARSTGPELAAAGVPAQRRVLARARGLELARPRSPSTSASGTTAGVLILVTTTLSLVIPSAPGGLGVFEAGGVVALRAFGVDDSTALSATVVLHALNVFPYVVAGSVVLHRHALRLRELQRSAANPNVDLSAELARVAAP